MPHWFGQVPDPEKTLPDPVQIIPGWCDCALATTLFALHVPDDMHLLSIFTRLCALSGSFMDWIIKPHHKLCLIIPSCHAFRCCEKDLFTQLPRAKNSRKGIFNQWKLHTQSGYGNVFHWDGLTDRMTDYNDSQQNSLCLWLNKG